MGVGGGLRGNRNDTEEGKGDKQSTQLESGDDKKQGAKIGGGGPTKAARGFNLGRNDDLLGGNKSAACAFDVRVAHSWTTTNLEGTHTHTHTPLSHLPSI